MPFVSYVLRSPACLLFSFSFGTDENDELTSLAFFMLKSSKRVVFGVFFFLGAFSFKYLSGRRNTFFACTHAGCFKMHLEAYSFFAYLFFSPYHLPIEVYLRECVFCVLMGWWNSRFRNWYPEFIYMFNKTHYFTQLGAHELYLCIQKDLFGWTSY